MTRIRVHVTTHWVNGWFVCLFARPFVVIDDAEHRTSFREPLTARVSGDSVSVGAGIRYGGTRRLMGCEPEVIDIPEDAGPSTPIEVVLRNGFWNHAPFRIVSGPVRAGRQHPPRGGRQDRPAS